MNILESTHQFALYYEPVSIIVQEAQREIHHIVDSELVHRIVSILRLEKNDRIILFNSSYHIFATIVGYESKKSVTVQIHEIEHNKQLLPVIHWVLPLLKRDAFEAALYTLTEMGAQSVQPLLTQKTVRFFGGDKEIVRCKKILIAAAEQSKQFVLPELKPIIPLDIFLLKAQAPNSMKFFLDPTGCPLKAAVSLIEQHKPVEIILASGPEGDLTYEEKMMLTDQGFIFCALTKSVLRAEQAVAVGLGALRSLLA